jgi:hypothetical protein
MWGECTINYPGAVRLYALSPQMVSGLGSNDGLYDEWRKSGIEVRLSSDSIFAGRGWRFYLWRMFYPLEQLDLLRHGEHPLPISYPGPRVTTATTPSSGLPLTGLVYHETYFREGIVCRFVEAAYGGRDSENNLLTTNDVYLFEWDIAGPWDKTPRLAKKVRLVDSNNKWFWDHHWILDEDHYLTWDEKHDSATVLEYQSETKPARVIASLSSVGPIRCNLYGTIVVNRSARQFVGEKNGLFIFDTKSLTPIRELNPSASLNAFFAARKDESSSKNSSCFLTDDCKLLVRIAVFTPANDPDYSVAIVYDVDQDMTREIPVTAGLRADVKDVEIVDGSLWFYVSTFDASGKWTQLLRNENGTKVIPISPGQNPDTEVMNWDTLRSVMVDLPGFEANPQPLDLDSEIQMQMFPSSDTTRGVIRYGDSTGKPAIFHAGILKFW